MTESTEEKIEQAVEQKVFQEEVRGIAISNATKELNLKTILSNVSIYLDKNDIVNWSVACREWSHIIDEIMASNFSWEHFNCWNRINWRESFEYLPIQQRYLNASSQLVPWTLIFKEFGAIRLFGVQSFNDFCGKVSKGPLNSSRSTCFEWCVYLNSNTENPHQWKFYWKNVSRKIQAFSKNVSHIRMDINWFSAESRAIGSLWAVFILGRMPQVKSIYLKQFQSPYFGKHSKQKLNYIQHEPMPRMVNLTSLTLEVDGRGHRKLGLHMDLIITRLLTESSSFLKKLVILQQSCDADFIAVLDGIVFDKLRELKLKMTNGDYLNGLLDKLQAPLLDKLSVEIEKLPAGEHLIPTFNRLHTMTMTNLESLQLKVNDIKTDEHIMWLYSSHQFNSEVLTVNSVKTLEIHHHVFLNYHAIFCCLPNLEYVHIWGNPGDVKNKGVWYLKKVKGELWFVDWLLSGRLNEYAPLWTKILPKLKVVTFNVRQGPCKKYTREEYIKIVKKMEQFEMSLKKRSI